MWLKSKYTSSLSLPRELEDDDLLSLLKGDEKRDLLARLAKKAYMELRDRPEVWRRTRYKEAGNSRLHHHLRWGLTQKFRKR